MQEKKWYEHNSIEFILIYLAIVVILILTVPFENRYWWVIYLLSIISYGLIILFVYYWTIKLNCENRDMRIVLLFVLLLMIIGQIFYYYTVGNFITIAIYLIVLVLLLYLIIRGWKDYVTLIMIIPVIFVLTFILHIS